MARKLTITLANYKMLHFCRCDKNGDGRLSEDEVKEVRNLPDISFSSSFFLVYQTY